MKLLIRLLINAVALWIAAALLPGMTIEDGFWRLLVVALVFGIVNALVRPIAKLLTLPVRLATLGLFTIVVNGLMLMLTAAFVDFLTFEGGFFGRLFTATLAAVMIGAISTALSVSVKSDDND